MCECRPFGAFNTGEVTHGLVVFTLLNWLSFVADWIRCSIEARCSQFAVVQFCGSEMNEVARHGACVFPMREDKRVLWTETNSILPMRIIQPLIMNAKSTQAFSYQLVH